MSKEKYKELLEQLHEVDLDGDIAEEIRDNMDVYWYDLTKKEQEEMRAYSHKLYIKNGHNPVV